MQPPCICRPEQQQPCLWISHIRGHKTYWQERELHKPSHTPQRRTTHGYIIYIIIGNNACQRLTCKFPRYEKNDTRSNNEATEWNEYGLVFRANAVNVLTGVGRSEVFNQLRQGMGLIFFFLKKKSLVKWQKYNVMIIITKRASNNFTNIRISRHHTKRANNI